MDILLSLLLLLVAARAAGELVHRVKLPALLGEILAGVVLGPSLLGLVTADAGVVVVADLGIFFIVYLAALELTLKDVKRSIRESGVYIAIGAFMIPLLSGVAVGRVEHLTLGSSIFLGIALAFTALPVSVGILTDLDLLKTDFGRSIVSAGLLCDVAGLAMIGVVLNVSAPGGFEPLALAILILRFGAFMGFLVLVDRLFRFRYGTLASWLLRASAHLTTKGAAFALPFIVALGFAFLADYLGLHFVVGAFFGTLLVSEHVIRDSDVKEVRSATAAITQGFLGPVFFAFIGLSMVASSLTNAPLILAVLAAALGSKFVGGYLGARWSKFSRRYCVAAGVAMNGRGAMELVVAALGLELGFINETLFSILVLMGVLTTFFMTFGLRFVLQKEIRGRPALGTPVTQEGSGGINGGA
ncbi:MAG TPA: cation:proton antiporter [Thermoplasmata archaeon]|jgi:Kef-type K+ transport system membrane component KefB|nr:cation:proton antiporter [Thermoplasmata archaeon]